MTEYFIPYEQAIKLKQLGFPQNDYLSWYGGINKLTYDQEYNEEDFRDFCCAAPLYQQAFRWFREKHELECCLKMNYDILNSRVMYLNGKEVSPRLIIGDKKWELMNRESVAYKMKPDYYEKTYTYEEAELACLNKLIEIVESNTKEK